ncbi:MAG: NAD(P)-dependent alcohol dehydrogenase [Gammaproteobacteria bacterium]|nr:NAD(P)-dependent alcohol dehydrogenase [Gammaproteobacteria bacterium]
MPATATAAVVSRPDGPFRLGPVELDGPRDDEVLVRVEACGICHTDLKVRERLPLPAVLGHEGTGTVLETGAGVTRFARGERVILSYPSCGDCAPCRRAEPFRCEHIPALKFGGARADGTKPVRVDGGPVSSAFFQQSSFATLAVAHERTLVPVRTDHPPELLAALPCGVQTGAGAVLNTFRATGGHPLVVIGVGAVGLSAVMAGRIVGTRPIVAVDVVPSRLELARELGADHAVDARAEDVVARLREALPRGARYVLETSATVAGLETGIACLGQGGAIGIVSAPPPGETFPFTTRTLFERVATLHGICQGSSVPRDFLPRLLALHDQGRFPVDRLVTAYDFADINRAVADMERGVAVKPVLVMPPG